MATTTTGPAIKGSTLCGVIDDVKRLRDSGRIDDALLDARLEADDRALLDATIGAASWYPIGAYGRLTELLLEVEGGGRIAYLAERGARTARRLTESGIYHQLDRANGQADVDPRKLPFEEQVSEFHRTMRLVMSLSGSIFNFGRWSVREDPDHANRFLIVIEDAEKMPDVAIATIAGFVNGVGAYSPHVDHMHWTGKRTAPGTIVFSMDAGVEAVYGGGSTA